MQQMVDQGIDWSVQTVKSIGDVFKTTPLDVVTEDKPEVAPLVQGMVKQPATRSRRTSVYAWGNRSFVKDKEPRLVGAPALTKPRQWGDRTFVNDKDRASPPAPVRNSRFADHPSFGGSFGGSAHPSLQIAAPRSFGGDAQLADIAARRNSSVTHQVNAARLLKDHASSVRLERGARAQKCGATLCASPSRPCFTKSLYTDNDNGMMR